MGYHLSGGPLQKQCAHKQNIHTDSERTKNIVFFLWVYQKHFLLKIWFDFDSLCKQRNIVWVNIGLNRDRLSHVTFAIRHCDCLYLFTEQKNPHQKSISSKNYFFFTSNIYFFTIQYISWLVFLVSIHIYKYRTSNFSCERVSTLHINKCTVDFDRIAFGASVHLANMVDHEWYTASINEMPSPTAHTNTEKK